MSAPDPFTPISLFSFPVFSTQLVGYEEHKQPLLKNILDLQAKYPGIVRSNRRSWHSGDEFFLHRSQHVAWMLEKVLKYARHALARYYDSWRYTELTLTSCWANVLGPGGWNAPHHHLPCHWSGVYYVQIGKTGVGPENPAGFIEFLNPNPTQTVFNQSGNFLYCPKEGVSLLFPSSLYHFVHPNEDDTPRVSIAFNYTIIPKAGVAVSGTARPGTPGTPGGPPVGI